MELTATEALLERQATSRLHAAMSMLLHRLRDHVQVYPMHQDDKMPEHDVVWVDTILPDNGVDGPGKTILDALKMHPELWAHAVPSEVCIVPRRELTKLLGNDAVEVLSMHGEAMVANDAAVAREQTRK